jgi:stearoyl-CoA desaturase (delta-9 desaturase)
VLFGPLGVTIWAVQMMWIPIMAAGIINGVGHSWGYRNFSCKDASRNIVPWGVLIGGEELHNNHHAYITSAKLSSRWYECDLGWMYIRGLAMFGLAKVRRVAPRLKLDRTKLDADLETLQAVITHRYAVVTSYARFVKQAYRVESARQRERARSGEFTRDLPSFRRLRQWFLTDEIALAESERARLVSTLEHSTALSTLYAMGRELTALWERSSDSSDELLARLQAWCRRAEQTNISALQNFARRLRCYS